MTQTEKHLDLLGRRATDRVTGLAGVVTSICFDLPGCILATLQPEAGDDGKVPDSRWVDVARLVVNYDDDPVMTRPDFVTGPVAEGRKGPVEKPAR